VFNKVDLLPNAETLLARNQGSGDSAVYISARTGDGLDSCRRRLYDLLFKHHDVFTLRIPKNQKIHIESFPKWSIVLKQRDGERYFDIKILAKPGDMLNFSPYIQRGDAQW
jgi:50S ribosomal subunit-associated GTPase HflX